MEVKCGEVENPKMREPQIFINKFNMAANPKPTFAFLLLKEHPYGREMLRQMLSEGFIPSMVINEVSGIADEVR
jgi:hypothetical protein